MASGSEVVVGGGQRGERAGRGHGTACPLPRHFDDVGGVILALILCARKSKSVGRRGKAVVGSSSTRYPRGRFLLFECM